MSLGQGTANLRMSNILQIFLYGFYLPILALGQTVHNVRIYQGSVEILKNPEYPGSNFNYGSTMQWNLQVEPDANIKVYCDDIRMGQRHPWDSECLYVYLSFDEGQGERKICGRAKSGYMYKSQSSTLTVKLMSTEDGSGFVHCMAASTKEPFPKETIELKPNGKAKLLQFSEETSPFYDGVWILRSTPGTRISFQCDIGLSAVPSGCELNIFTIYDNQNSTEYCGYKKLELITKENYGKVRILLDQHGSGKVRCIFQAVTGPNINEYMNAISVEVDSSEHGMKPGQRSTSCDCGRANKNNARIIFGIQAKENEFPWMVNLILRKADYISRCGASLITSRHVLTAAHCLVDKTTGVVLRPEDVDIVLAEHDRSITSGSEVTISSEKIFIKEEYFENKKLDIAMIYTKEQIEFNDKIGRICLEPNILPIINRRIIIMGWGQTEHNVAPNILLKSRSRVIDSLICGGESYDVCTTTKESSTCYGDSGSPLAWVDPETNRYVQVSIVSRGTNTDCKTGLGFSTEIAHFYNWIQEIILRTNPSEKTCHKV